MKRTNTCDPARLKERESLMKFARRNYMHTETSVIFSLFQKMTGSCGYRPNLGSRDGRVEDWRAGLGRSLYSLFLALSFASVTLSRPCHVSSPPATSNAACGFPALRSPVCFTSRVMGPIVLERLSVLASEPCSRCTAAEIRTAIAYSTASNRSPYGSGPAPYGA